MFKINNYSQAWEINPPPFLTPVLAGVGHLLEGECCPKTWTEATILPFKNLSNKVMGLQCWNEVGTTGGEAGLAE